MRGRILVFFWTCNCGGRRSIMASVMGDLLSLLLPPVCVGCGVLLRAPTSTRCLCRACDLTARPLSPTDRRLGDVEALFAFEGALAQALAAPGQQLDLLPAPLPTPRRV